MERFEVPSGLSIPSLLALRTSGHTSLSEVEAALPGLGTGCARATAVFGEKCQSFPDRLINIHY